MMIVLTIQAWRRRVLFAVMAALTALAVGSSALAAGPSGGGDFTISSWTNPVYLMRGGLPDCPEHNCDTVHNWEPRSFFCNYGIGCTYSGSVVYVKSVDGSALGRVDLEVLDLPPGVTSQTATRGADNRHDVATTPFVLAAASDAPLGDFVVTVRGTNDNFVREGQRPIRIVDDLPPMVQSPKFEPSTVLGGASATGTASLTSPAPPGGVTLYLDTGAPSVVSFPETVTIPEGVASTTFTVTTAPVSTTRNVLILISGAGTIGNAAGVLTVTP